MATWNYRIVKYKDGSGYGLHEVFYDENGVAKYMTAEPITFAVDTEEGPDAIKQALDTALMDATHRGVFEEPEEWPEEDITYD